MLRLDFDKIKQQESSPDGDARTATIQESPQDIIERAMQQIVQLGHFEEVYLFTEDALPLARADGQNQVGIEMIIESAILLLGLREITKTLGPESEPSEIVIEGHNHRKIVFRFLEFFNKSTILAFVVPPRKSFRGLANRLESLIQKVSIS